MNHDEVTQRRLLVREEWLSRAIGLFNQQASVTEARYQIEINKLASY